VKKYVKKFYYRISKIDPILENFNEQIFFDYLNSLTNINKDYSNDMCRDLVGVYEEIQLEKYFN
ncbi:hypothetical protein OAI94_01700, partial [bacterium]|nr:hypothetical protein [bacterium]